MLNKKINYIILVLSLFGFNGCIPANDHVGKPEAHYYKNSYNDRYYNDRYYR